MNWLELKQVCSGEETGQRAPHQNQSLQMDASQRSLPLGESPRRTDGAHRQTDDLGAAHEIDDAVLVQTAGNRRSSTAAAASASSAASSATSASASASATRRRSCW